MGAREAQRRAVKLYGTYGVARKVREGGRKLYLIGVRGPWLGSMHVYASGESWEQAVMEAELKAVNGDKPQAMYFLRDKYDIPEELDELHIEHDLQLDDDEVV